MLTPAQTAAIDHVGKLARRRRAEGLTRVEAVLRRAGVAADVGALAAGIGGAPVSLHFHPDRIARDGRTVVTDPDAWADWGSSAEALQHIKQLWHVLVRYGRPNGG